MQAEAHGIVAGAAGGAELEERRTAYMRYIGQGHEITVPLPVRPLQAADADLLQSSFDETYTALYGRTIPGLDVEILSWTVSVSTVQSPPASVEMPAAEKPAPEPLAQRPLFDPAKTEHVSAPVFSRSDLAPGIRIDGPALIAEDQTTTVVGSSFAAKVNEIGYIVMIKRSLFGAHKGLIEVKGDIIEPIDEEWEAERS